MDARTKDKLWYGIGKNTTLLTKVKEAIEDMQERPASLGACITKWYAAIEKVIEDNEKLKEKIKSM